MKNRSFPRWSAPLIGVVAGIACAVRAGLEGQVPLVYWLIGGAAIGGLAGTFVMLIDYAPAEEVPSDLPPHLRFRKPLPKNPSGVIGRFLAIAGLILCWIPFIGFGTNVAGRIVNRKSDDWTKLCSTVGVVTGGLVTAFVVVVIAMGG